MNARLSLEETLIFGLRTWISGDLRPQVLRGWIRTIESTNARAGNQPRSRRCCLCCQHWSKHRRYQKAPKQPGNLRTTRRKMLALTFCRNGDRIDNTHFDDTNWLYLFDGKAVSKKASSIKSLRTLCLHNANRWVMCGHNRGGRGIPYVYHGNSIVTRGRPSESESRLSGSPFKSERKHGREPWTCSASLG